MLAADRSCSTMWCRQYFDEFVQRRQGVVHLALARQIGDGGRDVAGLVGDLLDQQAQAQRGLRHAPDARHRHLPDPGARAVVTHSVISFR